MNVVDDTGVWVGLVVGLSGYGGGVWGWFWCVWFHCVGACERGFGCGSVMIGVTPDIGCVWLTM